jgi:hypothetical protein
VPEAIVCDNLKAGVTATCHYEPGVNRTYQELAEHYGTAILPTRCVHYLSNKRVWTLFSHGPSDSYFAQSRLLRCEADRLECEAWNAIT